MPSLNRIFGKTIPIAMPPEFADEPSLLTYLDISSKELKKIWWYRSAMYHSFSITKRTGKIRVISAPNERLKFLQRKLVKLLDQLYRVRNPVHGFVSGRSIKSNASSHAKRRHVINLDLADFFSSITENRVRGLLQALGIDYRVSEIVARICCCNGQLPQGAPTSPVLSNMICYRLDTALLKIAKASRAIYTRYADDLTFSTFQSPASLFKVSAPPTGRFDPEMLASDFVEAVTSNGFAFNADKAHYADRNARRVVTGLKINEMINVDRRYVRNLRATLNSVETLGLSDAQNKYELQYGGRASLRAHLFGKISWLKFIKGSVDPMVRSVTSRFNRCFPDTPLSVEATELEKRDRAVWVLEHEPSGIQGSCFFLEEVGLVTAAHCVKNMNETEIFHPSKPSNKFVVRVLKRDADRDLALLEHALPISEYFELERSDDSRTSGDIAVTMGYPEYGPGDRLNIRTGTISSLPKKFGVQLVEVTQKIAQGMSGGPLLDENNRVIGVNHKGAPEFERNLAIHISELKTWLGL